MDKSKFDTDKAVIIYALQGDGAKYMSSLLGLSDSSMLMSNRNVLNPEDAIFEITETIDKKVNFLEYCLREAQDADFWNDFKIFSYECFGDYNKIYNLGFPNNPELLPFNHGVNDIVDSGKYFFMCVHTPAAVRQLLSVWKNARVIAISHSPEFLYHYRRDSVNHTEYYGKMLSQLKNLNWHQIRGDDYQLLPPDNSEELLKNQDYVINDFGQEFFEAALANFRVADAFEDALSEYFTQLNKEGILEFFNSEWFMSAENTVAGIKKIYEFLSLATIDFSIIEKIHPDWLNTIKTVNYPCD